MSRHRRPVPRTTLSGALLLVLVICAFVAVSIAGFRPLGANAAEDPVRCTLTVPADPLSALGLATPYELSGDGCVQTDTAHSAFVQATVIDTATGRVSNYSPLVVTSGTQPAAAPIVPTLPAQRVVGIWFGFNGDELALKGTRGSLQSGRCVNGERGSIFGQYAYCNAPSFFAAANTAIAAGTLTVPPLGKGTDGLTCPTTRDFGIVDQDQSDNVTTKYYAVGDRTAQATSANAAHLPGSVVLTNASDNGLVDNRLDPAIGCSPWTAPDLGDSTHQTNSLALDELQAAARQAAPSALVPLNDPMVLRDGRQSPAKTDAYRAGVDMPPLGVDPGSSPAQYCRLMTERGWQRIQLDRTLLEQAASPDATADSLYTFLGARIAGSYDNLGCERVLQRANPFQVSTEGDVAVGVRMDPATRQSTALSSEPATTRSAAPPAPTAEPTATDAPTAEPTATDAPTAEPTATAAPTRRPTETTSMPKRIRAAAAPTAPAQSATPTRTEPVPDSPAPPPPPASAPAPSPTLSSEPDGPVPSPSPDAVP
jgi:hypothetical protein